MNLLRLLFALLVTLPLTACALSGGPVSGEVLEERTNQPIPGAIVMVRWKGDLPGFADSKTVCYHVESTVSDETGGYRIAAWSKEAAADWQTRIINKEFVVVAYKVGYGFSNQSSQKEEIEYLAPFTGTSGERLGYLKRVSDGTKCDEAGERIMNRLPLEKAIYEEAKAIAQTPEEKKIVETLLFGLESRGHGSMEALKRLTDRRSRGQ